MSGNNASPRRQVPTEEKPPPLSPSKEVPLTNHTTKTELPTSVLIKFLFFSFLMVAAPTGTFFISKRYFTDVMYSAVAALAAVNVVLFLFVMVAFLEDDGPAYSKKNE